MDTLLDLTGVPAPNSAILVEEEPVPQNLRSVEIRIAKQYRPLRPVRLTLRTYVTEAGAIRRFQPLECSDPGLEPPYYIRPLLELRFTPALYNGRPIAAWTTIELNIPAEP